jgi:NitT/TauT family transport system substrate-binding protein
MKPRRRALLMILLVGGLSACRRPVETLRVGYTPSLGSAAVMVCVVSGRFSHVGTIPIRAVVYNSGPAVIDALLFGDIDIAYVGPVPALSAYLRTDGRCAILAGAAAGGHSLVVSKDSPAKKPEDLRDGRVATPQVGDTADVAARCYFGELGFTSYEHGGNFHVMPIINQDLKSAFASGEVEAAWTSEPWASQLVVETGARELLDEATLWAVSPASGSYPVAVVLARRTLLRSDPKIVEGFLRIHAETTQWINENPAEAQKMSQDILSRLTGRTFAPGVFPRAWPRMTFSTEVSLPGLERNAENAARLGFLDWDPIDMKSLVDLEPLKRATTRPPGS